jgi:hypothetical protein
MGQRGNPDMAVANHEGAAMPTRLRQHTTTILIAMVTAAITAGGPALAAAVAEAVNADTVDQKHAVGSGATVEERAGRLVATNSLGRLPNNIIKVAPDAANLNGRSSSELTRVARVSSPADQIITTEDTKYGNTLTIRAPSAGYVLVNSSVSAWNPPLESKCTGACLVIVAIRHVQSGARSEPQYDSATSEWANVAGTEVFEVEAGINTFQTRVRREFPGGGELHAYGQNMTGHFSPFDAHGNVPLP